MKTINEMSTETFVIWCGDGFVLENKVIHDLEAVKSIEEAYIYESEDKCSRALTNDDGYYDFISVRKNYKLVKFMTFQEGKEVVKALNGFTYKPGDNVRFFIDNEEEILRKQDITEKLMIEFLFSERMESYVTYFNVDKQKLYCANTKPKYHNKIGFELTNEELIEVVEFSEQLIESIKKNESSLFRKL